MSSSNLREFNIGLKEFGIQTEKEASMLVRRVAFSVGRALIFGTPVGNPDLWKANNEPKKRTRREKGYVGKGYVGGRARANWIPTLATPSNATLDKTDQQGAATVALLAPISARFTLGDTIWWTNNVGYIEELNNGHSTQAPAGFVELAIQAGIREALK